MEEQENPRITRTAVQEMDDNLGRVHRVLDHGFVRVVDYMGDDAAVVQAARTSYGRGTKTPSDDRSLIRYLMRHGHTTPFEMCEIKLHVKLPVFVARQWIRHRTASVNEYSARYSILDREFYVPELGQLQPQSATNKQGRDGGYSVADQKILHEAIRLSSGDAYNNYESLIDEDGYNLSRELGRMVLPTNVYTQWYWKTDLHNLFHFLKLRCDSHAQWEIRQYANVISGIVSTWVPDSHEAFVDYRLSGCHMSRMEVRALREILIAHGVDLDDDRDGMWLRDEMGMSAREAREFISKMNG